MLKTTTAGARRAETHVTILYKAGMLAVITFTADPDGLLVTSWDPRNALPKRCEFKSPLEAVAAHTRALATTVQNGWQISYSGPPLKG